MCEAMLMLPAGQRPDGFAYPSHRVNGYLALAREHPGRVRDRLSVLSGLGRSCRRHKRQSAIDGSHANHGFLENRSRRLVGPAEWVRIFAALNTGERGANSLCDRSFATIADLEFARSVTNLSDGHHNRCRTTGEGSVRWAG